VAGSDVPLSFDSSLALRPNLATPPGEGIERGQAAQAQAQVQARAFAQALEGATSPGAATPSAGVRHVPPTRTPLSGQEAAKALEAAWTKTHGTPPSPSTLSILVGQWAHETGRGASMLNFNFGGLKGTGPSGASTVYRTREGFGANEVQIQDRFRAYASAEEGAGDYLSLLQRRYPEALQAADRGDPAGFVQALKSGGYFTGDPAAYTRSVTGLAQQALSLGFGGLGAGASGNTELGSLSPAALNAALRGAAMSPRASSGAELASSDLPSGTDAGFGGAPAPSEYSYADAVGRVTLLMSALRIGQLGEQEEG
jgi:hypothetical protein